MNNERIYLCFGVFIALLCVFFIGFLAGTHNGRNWERYDAIKAGAGRWIMNEKTSQLNFHYREVPR